MTKADQLQSDQSSKTGSTSSTGAANTGPLKGIRILDLTRILAGPSCTQLLGDLGADVIKIEQPDKGDDTRTWGPPFIKDAEGKDTHESAYYLCANRNKRSVAVDMASDEGAALLIELAGHCDIVVENFKVGGLDKYGLGAKDMLARFPKLIYCSITGFGQTGPNAHRPGYDIMAQGFGGMMSLTGEPDGYPVKVGVGIADIVCGLYASNAILAALHHRNAGGDGQHIDISLVDSQIAWLANEGVNYLTSGVEPIRRGNQHPNIVPYQVFEMSDGHVIVAVGNDSQFARFCDVIGMAELADDPRFTKNTSRLANRDEIVDIIAERMKTLKKQVILDAMEERNIPGGPVNKVSEVFETDQAKARGMKISIPHTASGSGNVDLIGNPLKLSGTPISYRRAPPVLGEHTTEVLREILGRDDGDDS